MATQLNLKDAETNARIAELARREGVSKTRAVRMAVDEALAAREAEWDLRVAEVKRLAAAIRAQMQGTFPTMEEIDAELYDENGSPK